jgi:tRNA(adenine34) deaminase
VTLTENDTHDLDAMRRALELARRAGDRGEVPVGAVVFDLRTGGTIAEASNTRERERDPAGHAELIAIREAAEITGDWRLNHLGLAVTLEPCPMCAGLIVNSRVGRVIYGAPDPKAGAVRTLYRLLEDDRLNHHCEVIEGVLADESATLLRAFFASLRRKA